MFTPTQLCYFSSGPSRTDMEKMACKLSGILEQIPQRERDYKSYIKFIQQERMTILNLSIFILKFV